MTHWPDDLDEREAEWDVPITPRWTMTREGAEHLARLAVTGSPSAPPPIRRHYGRDLLGYVGIIVIALGAVALGMLWER